jgi:serine/threonine protein kinase
MNTSPTATHSSSDAAQPSETSYFECPKCHRQCKSRTWFLKHLESCFKGPTHAGPSSGVFNSPIPASSGEENAGPSPAQQQQQQNQHHRAPRSTGTDDVVSSPVFESIGTSSPTSSIHSFQEIRSRKNSKLTMGLGAPGGETSGGGGSSNVPQDPSDGTSRVPALAFSFKHSNPSDVSPNGLTAKSPYRNSDDTPSRVFHAPYVSSSNGIGGGGSGWDGNVGGGGAPPALSQRPSMSHSSSTYVGSPIGFHAGTHNGESRSTAFSSNQRPSAASPTAAASRPTSGHQGGGGSPGQGTPRQLPARQGSFRLHSDGTWTQYTPTNSSSSSLSSSDDGNDNDVAAMNCGDSFLAYSGRQSSHSLSRSSGAHGTSNAATHRHQQQQQQHHYSQNNSNANPRLQYSHDAGSLSFNASGRLVSPAGPDTPGETYMHERHGSVGSNRNESVPGTMAATSQTRQHPSLSLPATWSLPREQERLVPRLTIGGIVATAGDQTPLDRKGSGVDGNFGGDRVSRSTHGSTSPAPLSRMSSSASPMFAQAMASPTLAHMSASLPSGASGTRPSGMNGSSSSGGPSGLRTPRQGDRSGAVTPRAISFQRGRAVGSGGFGTVYQAILADGSLAAVKELKLENTNLKAIDREVRAMSSIPPHPNCVRYLGSRYSAHHYYIIMEYISGGSINSLRKSVGRFRESVFQRYAYMVLLGLAHLHSHGIVHRDIKGANVLLDESGCAKIVDFGCSRDVNQATTTLSGGGTPLWMAPEVCRGEPATEKSDVWAFGCLCLEMTNETGLPWSFPPNITLQGVVYALACAKASPPIPADLSPEARDFLQQCLKVDAEERATVAELLQHPFFDVDLMEDSDEDEMLSSCPQSAVKRVVKQVRRSRIPEARGAVNSTTESENSASSNNDEVRVSPLVPGLSSSGQVRSPRGSLQNNLTNNNTTGSHTGNEGDLVVASQSTHSKSPSGPRLDHYPRSVNVGFSLQAVDDEDDEGETRPINAEKSRCADNSSGPPVPFEVAGDAGEEPPAFTDANVDPGGPPAIPSTSVPANRLRTPSMGSPANLDLDDEDEYTQMITEIITQAREAYTDEERRMTEQQRRRNDLYPSSDDEDGSSFSDSSNSSRGGSAGSSVDGAVLNRSRRQLHTVSGASSDITGTVTSSDGTDDDSDDDDGNEVQGGPQKHKLGATWRADRNSSSPVIPVNQARPLHDDTAREVVAESEGKQRSLQKRVQSPPSSSLSSQLQAGSASPPQDAEEVLGLSEWGVTASRRYRPPAHTDPQHLSLSCPSNPAPSSAVEASGSNGTQSPPLSASHPPPPHHHTPTSPPPPSSAFRDAVPKETVRDTRLSTSMATPPPKGVVAMSSGTPLPPSEPGGPGRTSAPSHESRRLSPSFLPLSTTTITTAATAPASAEASRNAACVDDHRSPRAPQPAPSLIVGGPSRQSSTGPRPSAEATPAFVTSLRHSPNGPSVEWCTGGSGRLERNVVWQTGASGEQPKELSMAQKEMQEMLNWGGRGSDCNASTVSSSSLGLGKRNSKDSGSDVAGDGQGTHHHRHHSRHEGEKSASLTEAGKGLSGTEKVEGKRRHLGLGIFRSRKSK